jgi:hypothetical protein
MPARVAGRALAAARPLSRAKRQAALTLGCIEPAAKRARSSSAALTSCQRRCCGVPQCSYTPSTSVAMTKASASRRCAISAAQSSLSITASTPCQCPCAPRTTGMPPPPPQTTTAPRSSSQPIGRASAIARAAGDGTTRRQPSPSRASAQPRSRRKVTARSASYIGPIGLAGASKAGSSASTSTRVSNVATARCDPSALPISCSSR